MTRRTLLEWERIDYGDEEHQIPKAQAERLAEAVRQSSFPGGDSGVLEQRRNSLRARGVVGVVAAPDCQLEILPKIEGRADDTADHGRMRDRLVHMLAVTHDLNIHVGARTGMAWQRHTLLEILIRQFSSRLADQVRQGLPRRYVEQEDDLPALRGRLDVTRQFTTLAAQPQKLACRFEMLSVDRPLNQVMKAAINLLSGVTRLADTQAVLRELAFAYADVSDVPPTALPWDRIVLDRTSERWRELLSLARLFLENRYQNTSMGGQDGITLLFEMNLLFEEYVARMLRLAIAGTGLNVSTQGGRRYCLFDENGKAIFQTRPDILIKRGDEILLIIDTKWKQLCSRIDDAKQGVSQADVYQMMAYNRLYNAPVMLLYPYHQGLETDEPRDYAIGSRDSGLKLAVATVDVAAPSSEVQAELKNLVTNHLPTLDEAVSA